MYRTKVDNLERALSSALVQYYIAIEIEVSLCILHSLELPASLKRLPHLKHRLPFLTYAYKSCRPTHQEYVK